MKKALAERFPVFSCRVDQATAASVDALRGRVSRGTWLSQQIARILEQHRDDAAEVAATESQPYLIAAAIERHAMEIRRLTGLLQEKTAADYEATVRVRKRKVAR